MLNQNQTRKIDQLAQANLDICNTGLDSNKADIVKRNLEDILETLKAAESTNA